MNKSNKGLLSGLIGSGTVIILILTLWAVRDEQLIYKSNFGTQSSKKSDPSDEIRSPASLDQNQDKNQDQEKSLDQGPKDPTQVRTDQKEDQGLTKALASYQQRLPHDTKVTIEKLDDDGDHLIKKALIRITDSQGHMTSFLAHVDPKGKIIQTWAHTRQEGLFYKLKKHEKKIFAPSGSLKADL